MKQVSSDWEAEDAEADRTLLSSSEEQALWWQWVFTGEPQQGTILASTLTHPSFHESVQIRWLTSANKRKKG